MKTNQIVTVDNKQVPIEGERNLLELIRKAGVEIPTFCYHSEMSIYGACRLCMVDVEGMGMVASCSTTPTPGMVVKTSTPEIRETRKMILELLLASHQGDCQTCRKGDDCKLLALANRLGVRDVRFKRKGRNLPLDLSSPSIARDPNKCILCGDCVRMCSEIQGVGAIGFAHRGAHSIVTPCFERDIATVECIDCGQCTKVCPTGALTIKSDTTEVFTAIQSKDKYVVAAIAPAVRVAIGEEFGLETGANAVGKMVATLKMMGFDAVYDVSYSADLTIFEEGTELLGRVTEGENLPMFTSCCPGWVKFMEQYYSDYANNLSTCKSPQQMLGSLVKETLPDVVKKDRKDIVFVSIMPCTAKKFEAKRDEFRVADSPDVDYVITTHELALLIRERGIMFNEMEPEAFDMPYGFNTGGGVIFGNSGGVSEAAIRFAGEKLTGKKTDDYIIREVRGEEGIREVEYDFSGTKLKMAVVSGLGNARKVMDNIKAGTSQYDFVEIMACPSGCINGGGQPVSADRLARQKRTEALYRTDKMLQLHKSQDNPYINDLYTNFLGKPGSHKAHELLHTHYHARSRIKSDRIETPAETDKLPVSICFGTGCFIRGSQKLLSQLTSFISANGLEDKVSLDATFCFEKCDQGPVVRIGDETITHCTRVKAIEALTEKLNLHANA
ncbi:MAG TPA: [FeFe] hydrogenase, group A [Candidatus Limiplasma sp.]|nr:[FeFe] hydrogenase, group A [Candidatus Limiplasma sp.]